VVELACVNVAMTSLQHTSCHATWPRFAERMASGRVAVQILTPPKRHTSNVD